MSAEANAARLLPLFWLKGEAEETLRQGVRQVKALGCGALVAESRTHPDFLGPAWWRDVGILLEECQRQDMKLWIFDDQHFPSGYAAGKAEGAARRMMLTEKHMDVLGPVREGAFVVLDDETVFEPGEGLTAVIAARRLDESNRIEAFEDIGGFYLGETIDLTGSVRDGMAYWDVPEGIWRIFVLTRKYVAERVPPRYFLNPLLPQSGMTMIQTVYEPHWQHFGPAFGKTFQGFFSDEPALRAGRGYRAVPGEYPRLPIPWREDMLEVLNARAGRDVRALLPGLWYEMGEETRFIRCLVMDAVSALYGENYCMPIGNWCRDHGVQYIGHVIEQNNAHTRLGSGAGHYFRAVSGQDMAGIDIVLHEIRPDFRGGSHAWHSQTFEAEDDFFRFMLGQMAVSAACIDPKKQGRTLCEIFGAYGWQEDVGEMRYLANLMLSRGVNHFSPHAFTLAPYPDRDSPPHFDAAHNPLTPFIAGLFDYMARVGGMIDGGRRLARTGVLYNAESEWACGTRGSMRSQAVVKALNQRQIECTVIPMDHLLETAPLFDVLLIPQAEAWPARLGWLLEQLLSLGKKIHFIQTTPEMFSDPCREAGPWPKAVDCIPLSEAAETVRREAPPPYEVLSDVPWVHLYPYEKDGDRTLLLMNEDNRSAVSFVLRVPGDTPACLLDMEKETCRPLTAGGAEGAREIGLSLEPGQLLAVLLTKRTDLILTPAEPDAAFSLPLAAEWSIALKAAGQTEWLPEGGPLGNITAPNRHPRFSGTVRYETEAVLPQTARRLCLGQCSGAVRAWMDGQPLGSRVAPPYDFSLPPAAPGVHSLRVEVTNAPVFAHRDPLSFFACVKPTGMLGPVTIKCTSKE